MKFYFTLADESRNPLLEPAPWASTFLDQIARSPQGRGLSAAVRRLGPLQPFGGNELSCVTPRGRERSRRAFGRNPRDGKPSRRQVIEQEPEVRVRVQIARVSR